jgi:hypothetical protein
MQNVTEVIRNLKVTLIGKTTRLSTSKRRFAPTVKSFSKTKQLSNFISTRFKSPEDNSNQSEYS